uniref:Uncharacterized protein n=1 Tax=Magallana gigas TaxID=29159 RepID=A0A8W8NRH3_MAGGI
MLGEICDPGDTVSGEEAIGPRNPMSASEAATGVLQAMFVYLHGLNEKSKIFRAAGDVEKRAKEDTPNNENSDWNPKKDDGDIEKDSEEIQCYE